MDRRLEDWPPNRRRLLLYGNYGYFWLDFSEDGVPSIPGTQRAWRAFRDYGPPAAVSEAYRQLRAWLKPLVARKVGPYAAARFGKEAREWLVKEKLNRQRAEGEKE